MPVERARGLHAEHHTVGVAGQASADVDKRADGGDSVVVVGVVLRVNDADGCRTGQVGRDRVCDSCGSHRQHGSGCTDPAGAEQMTAAQPIAREFTVVVPEQSHRDAGDKEPDGGDPHAGRAVARLAEHGDEGEHHGARDHRLDPTECPQGE